MKFWDSSAIIPLCLKEEMSETVVSDNENGPKNNNGRTFIDSHLIIPFIRRERQK